MIVSAIPSQCHGFDKFDKRIRIFFGVQRGFKSKICMYAGPLLCITARGFARAMASVIWGGYAAGSQCALNMYILLRIH